MSYKLITTLLLLTLGALLSYLLYVSLLPPALYIKPQVSITYVDAWRSSKPKLLLFVDESPTSMRFISDLTQTPESLKFSIVLLRQTREANMLRGLYGVTGSPVALVFSGGREELLRFGTVSDGCYWRILDRQLVKMK